MFVFFFFRYRIKGPISTLCSVENNTVLVRFRCLKIYIGKFDECIIYAITKKKKKNLRYCAIAQTADREDHTARRTWFSNALFCFTYVQRRSVSYLMISLRRNYTVFVPIIIDRTILIPRVGFRLVPSIFLAASQLKPRNAHDLKGYLNVLIGSIPDV